MNPVCEKCWLSYTDTYRPDKEWCQLHVRKYQHQDCCYQGTVKFYGIDLIPDHWYTWEPKTGYEGEIKGMYTGYFLTKNMEPEMIEKWGKTLRLNAKWYDISSLKECESDKMSGLSIFQNDYGSFFRPEDWTKY